MSTLVLGVIDLPYGHVDSYRRLRTKRPQKHRSRIITTGDVATILESRYHIFQHFWDEVKDEATARIIQSYADSLDSLLQGNLKASFNPAQSSMDWLKQRFDDFISMQEMDKLGITSPFPVPTQAALDGVSHRFKHPYARRPPRPSFYDTGLYRASFHAEMEL